MLLDLIEVKFGRIEVGLTQKRGRSRPQAYRPGFCGSKRRFSFLHAGIPFSKMTL